MTFLKYSANKKAASYDLKRAFLSALIPSALMLGFGAVFLYLVWNELMNYNTAEAALMKNFAVLMPYEIEFVAYISVFVGAVFALFPFIGTNKRSANFYYSLPVDSATLFKNRVLASFTCIAGALFLILLSDCVMNMTVFKD